MPAERPNFFLLLEMDPALDDWASIEPRIVEKQRAWSHDREGSPKARRRAESNLALLPEIRALLADPAARRQEARNALREQERAKQGRDLELNEMIAVLRSGGGSCSEAQLQKLVQQLGGVFTAAAISSRLRAAGVALGAETPPERSRKPAKETIDKVTAASLRGNLDHLQLATLYDFLELKPLSSPKALLDRAEEVLRENRRLGRTDAQASAQNALAGICKTVFQNVREKERYDNYLAIEAMEQLKPALELAGADGFINRDELDALVLQARRRGVSAEDARTYIEALAAARRWGVYREGGALPAEAFQLCGFCSTLAPNTAANCPGCGEALEIHCPRCGAKNPSANSACQSCGTGIGDAALVRSLLKAGERLTLDGDLAEAIRRFDKALLYWPGWKDAIEARGIAAGRQREREDALTEIEELVGGRKLFAARSALDRFERRHGASGLDELRRRIRDGIAHAEALFEAGESSRRKGDSETALDRFEEALTACADFEAALRAMAASPPPPPPHLHVTPTGGGFHLAWQAPAAKQNLAFRVVRKANGAPHGAGDGELLSEVRALTLDDASATTGTAWFYAVFSQRSGITCDRPALSGPHLRTAEVEELELLTASGEVALHWRPPQGCLRVEVWRQEGSPPQGPFGTALTVAGTSARDSGLSNGHSYGYRIVAVFADPTRAGAELRTPGKTMTATPKTPPPPVLDLTATRSGKTVLLSWSPVAGASVQIRHATRPPGVVSGLTLAASQADRFGALVPGTTGNSAQITLSVQGHHYFVPLSVADDLAVVGAVAEVATVDPVQNLQVRRSGPHLALTWDWPEGTDDVLALWGADAYPESPQSERAGRAEVSRRAYDRSGCWLLQNVERRPHYFSIFAKAPQGDLYAPPARRVETLGLGASVAYRVGVRKSLLRRAVEEAWIELTAGNGESLTLPPFLVIGKAQAVPLSPRDGELLLEVPDLKLEKGRARLPLPARNWTSRPYVKLYFKDAAAAHEIRLLPAEKERLQIG